MNKRIKNNLITNKKLIRLFAYSFICLFAYSSPVYAQSLTLPGGSTVTGPVPWAGNLGAILVRAVQFIFAFAGIGLLLMLLASGFALLTSAGDAKQMEKGKQQLTNAIIGFLIIFTAYWLTQIAGKILGIVEIQTIFK